MARETQADRLREARVAAGFDSAAAAASHFGWLDTTYRSHENGARGIRPDSAKRYARAFGVSAGWILTGDRADRPTASGLREIETAGQDQLWLRGHVEAGAWREAMEWPEDDWRPTGS